MKEITYGESRIEDVAEKMANDTYGMAEKFVAAEERVKVLTAALREIAYESEAGIGHPYMTREAIQARARVALAADQGSEE